MTCLTKAQFDVLRKKLNKEGSLTTSGVLLMAKNKTSALHNLFEWNDSVAAVKYRKNQARVIIKQYNINIKEPGEKVVHVPSINHGEGAYKKAEVVVTILNEFELAMDEALKKLKAAENSVSILQKAAQKNEPERAGMLAVVMQGLNAASMALNKVH